MIKSRTQPPELPVTNQSSSAQKSYAINRAINARLDKYIEANPDLVTSYRDLVQQDPEHAVRKLTLNRMLWDEARAKQTARELPQVRRWAEKTPGMVKLIEERIKDVAPQYRDRAFVNEAKRQKNRIDFAPENAEAELAS